MPNLLVSGRAIVLPNSNTGSTIGAIDRSSRISHLQQQCGGLFIRQVEYRFTMNLRNNQ